MTWYIYNVEMCAAECGEARIIYKQPELYANFSRPSPVTRVVRNKHWFRNNEWQLINVHEQSFQILSSD